MIENSREEEASQYQTQGEGTNYESEASKPIKLLQTIRNPTTSFNVMEEEERDTVYFHVVCHSHNDVGWLSTPDEYYEERVSKIISSVVEALLEDPRRRFSQTEIYYFERWWSE